MKSFARVTLSILVLLVVGARVSAQVQHAVDEAPAVEAAPAPVETTLKIAKTDTVIHVSDLHCKTCAKKIAQKLYAVKGVVKVRTDVAADVAIVSPQSKKTLDVKALCAAAQKAGFPPTKLIGPAGTYEADPETKAPVRLAEEVAQRAE